MRLPQNSTWFSGSGGCLSCPGGRPRRPSAPRFQRFPTRDAIALLHRRRAVTYLCLVASLPLSGLPALPACAHPPRTPFPVLQFKAVHDRNTLVWSPRMASQDCDNFIAPSVSNTYTAPRSAPLRPSIHPPDCPCVFFRLRFFRCPATPAIPAVSIWFGTVLLTTDAALVSHTCFVHCRGVASPTPLPFHRP